MCWKTLNRELVYWVSVQDRHGKIQQRAPVSLFYRVVHFGEGLHFLQKFRRKLGSRAS
jgi:hypothetical protein